MKNPHKVPAKQWQKWNKKQRKMFNGVYEDIMNVGTALFVHPITMQRKLSDDEFRTIAWNAAWTAADVLKDKRTSHMVTQHKGETIAVDPIPNQF